MKKKRKKGRKPICEKTCTYCMEILDWEMPYSFSLSLNKDITPGPFWDSTSLKIKGRLFQPKKHANKVIDIDIHGERWLVPIMSEPKSHNYEPEAVGLLTIWGQKSEFFGWVPFDVLHSLILLLHARKINFLILSGQPLYRGNANIRSMYFEKEYKEEDW